MKKRTCNLGEMYSYWANSTVNSSGVAGNHRSWKIYLSQKSGTIRIVPGTLIIFMCCYLSTDLSQPVFDVVKMSKKSQMLPINTPCMMGDGDECLQSCMM